MNQEILRRIVAWNSARYHQEYNAMLTYSLLAEEATEFMDATTRVDELDALVDIYYIAVGALWKLGVPMKYVLGNELMLATIDALPTLVKALARPDEVDFTAMQLLAIMSAAVDGMRSYGFNDEQITRAILIVCDSNDTKVVMYTDPAIKANIDKGPDFVRPEARLQQLLNEVNHVAEEV